MTEDGLNETVPKFWLVTVTNKLPHWELLPQTMIVLDPELNPNRFKVFDDRLAETTFGLLFEEI